ncbi:FAD:protein FMN transferase [Aeromicrobium phragmitis]|uniref:FAD:protein FMN transferase n=1 Tax=Aeromicrobium phragmitis TaxID=2478914 RepID=A0A3L8PLN8_9ACTN|nr:FAD:protein FMN transferase [Aeromicrobium phragmitis]RLV54922.1 FAD:protein FMN transferase [Aeromicrobium phragmitis]
MWAFDAIGTRWCIDAPEPVDTGAVREIIDDFDRTWSRFRDDALVARLRTQPSVDLGSDAPAIFGLYDRLDDLTDGAVSPAIGASLEQLGYDAQYTLTAHGEAIPALRWRDVHRDGSVVTVDQPVVVDVGAVGKGFVAQRIADLLPGPVTVDASGDIVHRGTRPLRVALEHPLQPDLAIGVVDLAPGNAICASAINRRTWGDRWHHVLDARTGEPTRDVLATWVVAPDAALADGLATALFFVESDRVLDEFPEVGCAVVDATMRVRAARMTGEIFR